MSDDWMEQGACLEVDVDLFFPEKGVNATAAKAVCCACPVRTECLAYAIDNTIKHGVWGGMTERERRRLRARTWRVAS